MGFESLFNISFGQTCLKFFISLLKLSKTFSAISGRLIETKSIDWNLRYAVNIVHSWRNYSSHKSIHNSLDYESEIYHLIGILRFLSLIPLNTYPDDIDEFKRKLKEKLYLAAKNYFEIDFPEIEGEEEETSSETKGLGSEKADMLDKIYRRLDVLTSTIEVMSSNKDIDKDIEPNFIESFDEEETSEEILTLENSLTEEGAREQLIALREKISNENPDSKSWRSVLRNSMLKNILEKRITNLEDFKKNISGPEFRKTDESNFVYFDQIKLVIDRIKDD